MADRSVTKQRYLRSEALVSATLGSLPKSFLSRVRIPVMKLGLRRSLRGRLVIYGQAFSAMGGLRDEAS